MAWLVAAQMSWAGAPLCCVQELGEAPTALQAAPAGDAGEVCDSGHCHCHHAGCATPLAEAGGLPLAPASRPEPTADARPRSHIPAGLDRPDWLRA